MGALSGSQNLNLINDTPAAVTLTVGFNNVSAVYSGILGGTGSVDKLGSGTITIGSGANGGASYTGATRVDGGTLILGGIGNLNATGTLDISGVSPGNVIVRTVPLLRSPVASCWGMATAPRRSPVCRS